MEREIPANNRRRRQLHSLLREIVELRKRLSSLPEPHSYERHEHIHKRMDELVVAYMRLQESERGSRI